MDIIKDVEELGLTHGAIIHGWYYIVYVVSLYSIMDVLWRSSIKPWSNIHGWYFLVYVVYIE